MKTFARVILVLALTLFAGPLRSELLGTQEGAYSVALAFNDNQEACSIPSDEFVSLIQSINHAEQNFLFETDELVPRMWWGAILGFNESLEKPLERDLLERTILELREREFFIPELTLFQRIQEVRNERNALDFFLLVSDLCEERLVTKGEVHTDSAIRRAHASLGDRYSLYLTPAETQRYVEEGVLEAAEVRRDERGLAHTYQLGANTYLLVINSFSPPQVAHDVRRALELIVEECPSPHIILDLRNNVGGTASASVAVPRNFLRNQTIVQFEYKDGIRVSFTAKEHDNSFHFRSTTVLINQLTASGAELVTAALGENGARTVGSKTFGKGVGQYVERLSNGGTSRITSFSVFSPLGNSWQNVGIIPEVDPTTHFQTPPDTTVAVEMLSILGDFYFDQAVAAAYRLIREDGAWHPGCDGP